MLLIIGRICLTAVYNWWI